MATQTFKLNNGLDMPVLGLGTWAFEHSGDREKMEVACYEAIKAGYRHIDTAWIYKVEDAVGRAVRKAIDEGIIKREDIFITTKVWATNLEPQDVLKSCAESHASLGLGHIDLLLIHYPVPFAKNEDGSMKFTKDGLVARDDIDIHLGTWRAMEECVKGGTVKSIGVSNYDSKLIDDLMATNPTITPATNQVECHPFLSQEKLLETCSKYGIRLTAYSQFGGNPRPKNGDMNAKEFEEPQLKLDILSNPVIAKIAANHNKKVTQVLLKFHTQRGIYVIPKTTSRERLLENMDIFDFELTEDEMAEIKSLNTNTRLNRAWFANLESHKYTPHFE